MEVKYMSKSNLPVLLLKNLVLLPLEEARIELNNDVTKKIIDISKKYFNDVAVRLGKPIGTTGSHDFVKSPSFSTAAGTALYCLGEFSGKGLQNDDKSLWQRLMVWFKRGV